MVMYHGDNRSLQQQFGSEALADRFLETIVHERFTDADKQFIERSSFFFLATADADGRPDCSFKGGLPGFVRVIVPNLLIFRTMTGTACSRALAILWPIRMWGSCSSPSRSGGVEFG